LDAAVYEQMRAVEETHWWFRARRSILRVLVRKAEPPPQARLLEVGCGTGGNLPLLKEFGAVSALEPNSEARRYIAEHRRVRVDEGRLPDAVPYPPGSFDLVCAFDVIEHLDDPIGSLTALGRLLGPDGRLVATVPALPWMWSEHDVRHHHKRRYTRRSLTAHLEAAGFAVGYMSYFNTLLLPAAVLQRTAKKLLGLRADDDAMPPLWLNSALAWLFEREAPWLERRRLPIGLSLAVVALPRGSTSLAVGNGRSRVDQA